MLRQKERCQKISKILSIRGSSSNAADGSIRLEKDSASNDSNEVSRRNRLDDLRPPEIPSVQDLRHVSQQDEHLHSYNIKSSFKNDDHLQLQQRSSVGKAHGNFDRKSLDRVVPESKYLNPSTSAVNKSFKSSPRRGSEGNIRPKDFAGQPIVEAKPTRFEIVFDGKDEAALLAKKEAKIFALRQKNEASRLQVRSKSAGVYRRRESVGDVMEERSIRSMGKTRNDDNSCASSRVSHIENADRNVERGYLYFHEVSQKSKGVSKVVEVCSTNEENSHLGYEGLQHSNEDKKPEPSGAVSPITSVSSKRRASSVGKYSKHMGSRLSNLQQVRNAIAYVCMAGPHLDASRNEALLLLDQYSRGGMVDSDGVPINPVSQFIIMLINSKTLSFRSIYIVHPTTGMDLLNLSLGI